MPLYKKSRLWALSAGNFCARYHHYLIAFVISTFLAGFMSEVKLGFVIAGASAVIAASLILMPNVFTAYGTKRALMLLGLVEMIIVIGLSLAKSALPATILFTLQGICAYNMFLGLDLLLEAHTIDEQNTGRLRGLFLVCANASVLAASLSLGFILTDHNYGDVFLIAAASLAPFILIAAALPAISRVNAPIHISFRTTVRSIVTRADILPTISAHFLLLMSFMWFIIYIPLHLYNHIGFSWQTIGFLIALSLVPSILFEFPIGIMADLFWGEKEMAVIGFVILILSTAAVSFTATTNIIPWAIAVFFMGLGGAMVEVTTESHFFKRVSAQDAELIGIFRMLRPIAAIVGPAIASIALFFVPFSMIFVVFGVVLILGIPLSLSIVDTR